MADSQIVLWQAEKETLQQECFHLRALNEEAERQAGVIADVKLDNYGLRVARFLLESKVQERDVEVERLSEDLAQEKQKTVCQKQELVVREEQRVELVGKIRQQEADVERNYEEYSQSKKNITAYMEQEMRKVQDEQQFLAADYCALFKGNNELRTELAQYRSQARKVQEMNDGLEEKLVESQKALLTLLILSLLVIVVLAIMLCRR